MLRRYMPVVFATTSLLVLTYGGLWQAQQGLERRAANADVLLILMPDHSNERAALECIADGVYIARSEPRERSVKWIAPDVCVVELE